MDVQGAFNKVQPHHAIIGHKDFGRPAAVDQVIGFDDVFFHLKAKKLADQVCKVGQIAIAAFFTALGLRHHVAAKTDAQVHGMHPVANFHQIHAADFVLAGDGADGPQRVQRDAKMPANGIPGANGDDAQWDGAVGKRACHRSNGAVAPGCNYYVYASGSFPFDEICVVVVWFGEVYARTPACGVKAGF